MDGIINGIKVVLSSITGKLLSDIKTNLQDNGIQLNDAQLAAISSLFDNATNPFKKLETRYQQDKYIQEYLNYLVSKCKCFKNTYKYA